MARWLVLTLWCGCGFACSEGGGSAGPQSLTLKAFEFSEYCAESGGERCERCRADLDLELEACFRVCAALAERTGSSACFASCGVQPELCDDECGFEPGECAVPGFRFRPRLPVDAAVDSACAAANSRNRACRAAPIRTDCAWSSQVEHEAAASAYACLAELPCGAPVEPCLSGLGESTFGESLADACPSEPLDEALIATVNRAAVWVRDEALDDAFACSEHACSERRFQACVQAWVGAL